MNRVEAKVDSRNVIKEYVDDDKQRNMISTHAFTLRRAMRRVSVGSRSDVEESIGI